MGTVTEQEQEAAWIEAFLAGDIDAFDRLVLRYKDRVFNLCYRLMGEYEQADDCAQDTFVKVYRSLKNFRFESSFSTWLYTIAVNHCRNKRKSRQYRFWRRTVPIDPLKKGDGSGCLGEIEDPAPSPFVQMAKSEQDALLLQAISSLQEKHRTLIILRDMEGFSYDEIVRITGYNLGTVKSKLARARQLLRNKLKDY